MVEGLKYQYDKEFSKENNCELEIFCNFNY